MNIFVSDSSTYSTLQAERTTSRVYVDIENVQGPWMGSAQYPFQNISTALTFASPNDTILINPGVYDEVFEVTIPLKIIGINSPVIDGGYQHYVITVNTSDVLLKNLNLRYSDGKDKDAGVKIQQGENVTISGCIFHHTRNGVFVNHSDHVFITDSWFFHSGNGIRVDNSSNLSVLSCDFARNSMGIFAQYSNEITVYHSTFTGNGMSGFFYRSSSVDIKQCNLTDNSVNKGGLFFSDSQSIRINHSLFRHNGVAISLSNASSVGVTYCDFIKNTHFALSLRKTSEAVMISNCIISESIRNAIYIEEKNTCTISNSHLMNNYLYSILAKPGSHCLAIDNWWNNYFGPWSGFLLHSNKVSLFQADITVFPWQTRPLKDIGVTQPIPNPGYNHTFEEEIPIPCDDVDSDQDGVSDGWEIQYGYDPLVWDNHKELDPDEDGLSNVQEYFTHKFGSHPFRKDVFLEIDWMHCDNGKSNKPDKNQIRKIIDSYALHNISLHIDMGSMGGGEEIEYDCTHIPTYAALQDLYWTYFLENDLKNPRKNIFHYGLICNFCPDLNFPFMGWNALDSFAISVEWLAQSFPQYDRQQLILGGIAHHLGHTLGLIADIHPGIDNIETIRVLSSQWREFYNYKSCMNYFYKYRDFTFSDGKNGSGDFNDWAHLNFTFFQESIFKEND
ncbi:MAG: right-handed parallel beta-helix repeat-containing protein [Thermoplasmatota archaeon]